MAAWNRMTVNAPYINSATEVAMCLFSTDLAARGLDIPEIENVVHYHLPANEDGISIVTDVPPVGKPKEIHTLFFMLKKHCPDI